jgi:hypothetical protein
MFTDLTRYPWVLTPLVYSSASELVQNVEKLVIPADALYQELHSKQMLRDARNRSHL